MSNFYVQESVYPIFANTVVYGSPSIPITFSTNSNGTGILYSYGQVVSSGSITVSFNFNNNYSSTTPVGSYTITNYDSIHVVPQIFNSGSTYYYFFIRFQLITKSLSITPATLTVFPIYLGTFNYGSSLPNLYQYVTGFVNGETTSVITGWPVYATCATTLNSSTPAGTYTITPNISGLSSTNYTFTAGTNATITIQTVSNTSLIVLPKPNQFKNLSTTPDISYSFYDSQNNLVNPLISSGVVSWQTSTGATITSTTTSGVYSISYNGNLTSSNYTFISGTPVNFTVLAPQTNFRVGGTDLNQIFQPKTSGNTASETNFNSIENLFEPL